MWFLSFWVDFVCFAASTKPSVRFFDLFFAPYAFSMVERFSCTLFFDPYVFFMVERFSCTLEIHSVLFFHLPLPRKRAATTVLESTTHSLKQTRKPTRGGAEAGSNSRQLLESTQHDPAVTTTMSAPTKSQGPLREPDAGLTTACFSCKASEA